MPLNRELDLLCGTIVRSEIWMENHFPMLLFDFVQWGIYPCFGFMFDFSPTIILIRSFNLEKAQHADLPPLEFDNNFAEGSHMVDDLCDGQREQGVPIPDRICLALTICHHTWLIGLSLYPFNLNL
jgi:hypothetical protein